MNVIQTNMPFEMIHLFPANWFLFLFFSLESLNSINASHTNNNAHALKRKHQQTHIHIYILVVAR